jgi:hypothetical protein
MDRKTLRRKIVMALPLAAIPIIGGLIEKVLDKVAPDKMSQAEKAQLVVAAQKALHDNEFDTDEAFRKFVLAYEGAAADMPKVIQIIRGLIRPVITIATNGFFFYIVWTWFTGTDLPENSELAVKMVFALTLLVDGFWFGEKMVMRSGLTDLLKNWNNK